MFSYEYSKMNVLSAACIVLSLSCVATGSHVFCKGLGYFEDHHGPFFNWLLPNCPEELNLKMALFTRNNSDSPKYLKVDHVSSTLQSGVKTIFLIHGYSGSHQSWQDVMRKQLLIKGDFNVIEIYWDSLKIYQQSASDTRTVGAAVGEMARQLATQHGIDELWCIGHSLGAHACGLAGKRYHKGFKRITGLDPAGPMFKLNRGVGLQSSDAGYVDAIHTDGSLYGEMLSVGQTDFFVNGGKKQPGCILHICQHSRSVKLFTSSINAKVECTTTMHCRMSHGKLTCHSAVGIQALGYDSDLYTSRGLFRIKMISHTPFC